MKVSLRLLVVVLALFAVACDSQAPVASASLGPHAFGERCLRTEDCASGLCLRIWIDAGVCTHACTAKKDCPASANWACLPPDGFDADACACRKIANEEICGNGLDDDCNGLVDDCTICDGKPVARDDHDNCGSCGRACRADQTCSHGKCECAVASEIECNGRCVDVSSDALACGACGNACPNVQTCRAGACTCPSSATPDYCAGTGCVDRHSDASNCGTCGNACGVGQVCSGGACACPAGGPHDWCAGVGCVDRQSDLANCGACGHACGAGQVCTAGVCGCPSTAPLGCATGCVDPNTNNANCGSCGNACPAGQYCAGGTCLCSGGWQTACGATCANLTIDVRNCGACGNACLPGEICSNGTCTCLSGLHCGGACTPSNDTANCGACGATCASGQYCSAGKCTCSGYGLTACGAACVNVQTDAANCGACGSACRATEVCTSGKCACPSGQTWCDAAGGCVNLQSDAANCGACGNACRATEVCSYGKCTCSGYSQKWCASSNACVDTYANNSDCGACDVVCPAATSCTASTCKCTTAGLTLCATSCVDTKTDATNCGACGKACGGTMVCAASSCVCPAPTAPTSVRLTNAVAMSEKQSLATDGTHVAMAWFDGQGVTQNYPQLWGNVYFTLLNLDGTRAIADVALTTPYIDEYNAWGPWVYWLGDRWIVAWYTSGLNFQTFDPSGKPVGSPTVVTQTNSGVDVGLRRADLAYSPTQGFATVYVTNSGVVFRRLGPLGASPETPNVLLGPNYNTLALPRIAASPTGEWGVFYEVSFQSTFARVNADGSHTIPDVHPNFFPKLAPPLVHDGQTWLTAVTKVNSTTSTDLYVYRGDALASEFLVYGDNQPYSASSSQPAFYPAGLDLASGVLTAWLHYDSGSSINVGIKVARYRLPVGPTNAPTPILAAPAVVDPAHSTSPFTSPAAVAWPTASTAFVAWPDTRWGSSSTELYGAAVDFLNCP